MNHENDTDIQIAFASTPPEGASDELKRRLRVAARETPARRPLWRSGLLPSAVAACAVGALVVAGTLTPAKASAKTFDLIVAAAQRVNAFQFSIRSDEGGKRETFSIAGQDGRVTMKSSEGQIMRFEPGTMSIYDPGEKKIMRMKFAGMAGAEEMAKGMSQGLAEGLKEMDLKKMLSDYRQKYGAAGITVSPVKREDGEAVYHVVLSDPDQPERVEMTVNAETDLPERIQVGSKDGSQTSVDMELQFGARVDPSLLSASFPAGAKVEEIDLGKMMGDAMKEFTDGSTKHP